MELLCVERNSEFQMGILIHDLDINALTTELLGTLVVCWSVVSSDKMTASCSHIMSNKHMHYM